MNEGNRVPPGAAPQGPADATPAARPQRVTPSADSTSTDFELPRPGTSAEPVERADAAGAEARPGAGEADSSVADPAGADAEKAEADGFEAERSRDETPEAEGCGRDGTDTEQPEAEAGAEWSEPDGAGTAKAAVVRAGSVTGGDFELAEPVPVPTGDAGAGGDAETVVPAEPVENAWAAPTERPKPLHDPDPYGTPPYGEPGPWAPAPPVQHPAATSAQGTPAPPTPAPGPLTPGAAAPAPAAEPAVPAPGVSVPGAPAPVPGVPAPPPVAPAPGSAGPGPEPGFVAPVPGASAPVPDSAVPAPGVSVPGAPAPVPGVPAPASGSPAPAVPPLSDPWARYDPWAAAAAAQEQVLRAGAVRRRRWLVGWTLVVALVAAGVGGVAGAYVERQGFGGEVNLPQAGRVPAGRAPDSVAGIAARALPSVVTLHVSGTDQTDTGTGFVLDAQGHILTNNHVVAPAGSSGSISVTFSSGDSVKATVVGHDSGYDLAVVQVHGVHGLTPLPLGNSDDVRVGDPVVAIGAPFDLANTVTSGIISAKERPITAGGDKGDGSDVSYVDALQTDAPINPGNSGGPLLDSHAQVIGINSAIRSADDGSDSGAGQAGSIGLGFAIPVNQAKCVAEELIDDGHATHPVIGVTLDMAYTGDGARIDGKSASGGPAVIKGGPGDRAGLKAVDVITEVDGQRVHTAEELIVKIRAHRPGDRLRLTVRRDGADREVPLVLGAAEQN